MDMKILTYVDKQDGSTWIRFETIDYWYYFPLPLEFFEQENNCTVLSNQETTDFREARLKKDNIEFELLHDDLFGNCIRTNNLHDVPTLVQLANNVLESIIKAEKLRGHK